MSNESAEVGVLSPSLLINDYINKDYPLIVVPYIDDDFEGYKGYLYDIPAIEYFGETKEEVIEEIENVKREWLTYALEEDMEIPEPFAIFPDETDISGKLTLRLPKSLHREIIVGAKRDGVSLNTYLINLIQKGIANNNYSELENNLISLIQEVRAEYKAD